MIVFRIFFFVLSSVAMFWLMAGGTGNFISLVNFHSLFACVMGGIFYVFFQVDQACKLKRFYCGTYCSAILTMLVGLILILKDGNNEADILFLYFGNNFVVLFYACFINEFLIKGLLYYEFYKK